MKAKVITLADWKARTRPLQMLSGDALRWHRVRANKRNQKTASRIELLKATASPEHVEVLREAIETWADKVNVRERFPGIKDILTSEGVYHLVYCDGNSHESRYERTLTVKVALAIVKGKTAAQCRQLLRSKAAYYHIEIGEAASARRAINTVLESFDAAFPDLEVHPEFIFDVKSGTIKLKA